MLNDPNADAGSAAAQIPLQGTPVRMTNPMENLGNAYSLADLALKTNTLKNENTINNLNTADTLATRQALANNSHQDPQTGQIAIDLPGTLKDLAKASPTAAVNFQLSMQQRQAELAEKQATLQQTQLGNNLSRVNLVGQLVQHVNSQEDLDRVRAMAPKFGIDPNQVPETFDPKERDQLVSQAVKASDMLNNKIEMGRLQLTAAKNTNEILQADAAAANEVAGQYKDDPQTKEYVNVANTYTSFKSMEKTKDFSQGIKDRDLLYNFQNIINPNRSATGGTIEQDEEARSTLQSIGVDIAKIGVGSSLSPSQRQQISSFIEQKYKDTTLQQQAVFNQAQNRLINMRALGRNVDPYHTLPMYGSVVDHVPASADTDNYRMSNALTSSITGTGGVQAVSEDDLKPPTGTPVKAKGAIAPPPGEGEIQGKLKPTTKADVQAHAAKYGLSYDAALKDVQAKGYVVQ